MSSTAQTPAHCECDWIHVTDMNQTLHTESALPTNTLQSPVLWIRDSETFGPLPTIVLDKKQCDAFARYYGSQSHSVSANDAVGVVTRFDVNRRAWPNAFLCALEPEQAAAFGRYARLMRQVYPTSVHPISKSVGGRFLIDRGHAAAFTKYLKQMDGKDDRFTGVEALRLHICRLQETHTDIYDVRIGAPAHLEIIRSALQHRDDKWVSDSTCMHLVKEATSAFDSLADVYHSGPLDDEDLEDDLARFLKRTARMQLRMVLATAIPAQQLTYLECVLSKVDYSDMPSVAAHCRLLKAALAAFASVDTGSPSQIAEDGLDQLRDHLKRLESTSNSATMDASEHFMYLAAAIRKVRPWDLPKIDECFELIGKVMSVMHGTVAHPKPTAIEYPNKFNRATAMPRDVLRESIERHYEYLRKTEESRNTSRLKQHPALTKLTSIVPQPFVAADHASTTSRVETLALRPLEDNAWLMSQPHDGCHPYKLNNHTTTRSLVETEPAAVEMEKSALAVNVSALRAMRSTNVQGLFMNPTRALFTSDELDEMKKICGEDQNVIV